MTAREPIWSEHRRRVPGAPADLTLHVLRLEEISSWAFLRLDCLTEEELAKARGLQEARSRELLLVSRVALRHVLAHRLGCRPEEVPIHHDARTGAPDEIHGRAAAVMGRRAGIGPELAPSPMLGRLQPVHFSVSRTEGVIALATAARAVGVDVERLQSDVEAGVLLDVLHPEDRARLSRLRGRRRARAVTRSWVRVEALVKGWGTGLSRDPSGILVGARPRTRFADDWWVSDVGTARRENARLAVAWRMDPDPLG